MVTVIPYFAAIVVFTSYLIFSNRVYAPNGVLFIQTYFFPVELLNFLINPIIYARRLPDYRRSLYFYFRKSRNLDVSNTGSCPRELPVVQTTIS